MYIRELYSPFPKMLILFEIIKKFEAGNILENMVCVLFSHTVFLQPQMSYTQLNISPFLHQSV